MRIGNILVVTALVLSASATSASTLITFDGTPDNYATTQSYDGFDFTFDAFGWGVVAGDFATTPGGNVLNGTNHLMLSGGNPGNVTITRTGGGTFSIASFDSATAFLRSDGQMLVTGFFDGGGTIATLFDLNPFYESQSLVGYSNLVSIVFAENTDSGFTEYGLGLDNLLIDSDAVVPEPATWAMLIAGFGLVGLAARRRRNVRFSG